MATPLVVFLIVLTYAVASALHLPALKEAGQPRAYWAFFSLTVVSLAFSLALVLLPDRVPDPVNLINHVVAGFGRRFFQAK